MSTCGEVCKATVAERAGAVEPLEGARSQFLVDVVTGLDADRACDLRIMQPEADADVSALADDQ